MKRSTWYIGLMFLGLTLQISLWGIEYEEFKPQQPGIPKVAHFVYGLWDTKPLPKLFKDTIQMWKQQGWTVKLWNKDDVEALLNLPEYSEYREFYDHVGRNIQKADLARYVIVLHEGGFYFDLDCKPATLSLLKRVDSGVLNSHNIFFIETVTTQKFALETANLYPIRRGVPECCQRIANFAFGAEKGSAVLTNILQLACERCRDNPVITCDYDVLYTTGPDCVTEAVNMLLGDVFLIKNTYKFLQHMATGTWRHNSDVSADSLKRSLISH